MSGGHLRVSAYVCTLGCCGLNAVEPGPPWEAWEIPGSYLITGSGGGGAGGGAEGAGGGRLCGEGS